MTTKPTTIQQLLDYWPGNIPFKGSLVSRDGACMCAQGQALHFLDGLSVDELRNIGQEAADKRVAEIFGISVAHSILLRRINDGQEGAPTCVIRNPEQVLGDQAQTVLAFWRHLDCMTRPDWDAVRAAAWNADWVAVAAAAAAAEDAPEAGAAAAAEAAPLAGAAAAAGATYEIQGAAVMRAKNQPFYFLPLFGFADPEAVMLLDAAGVEVRP